jgi:hypothetical protein
MCDKLIRGLYICDDCWKELKELAVYWPPQMTYKALIIRVMGFMLSEKELPGQMITTQEALEQLYTV